jgi:hypothetical protein
MACDLPTPREDTAPCAGHGAHGRLVRRALGALLLSIDLGPAGLAGGCSRPCHNRLAPTLGPRETPGAPGLLATACRPWRHPCLCVACVGRGKAFPWCAAGDEEAGSTHGPHPWPGVAPRAGGMARSALDAGGVAVGQGLSGPPAWGDEAVPAEARGGPDAVIGGPCAGALAGRDAGGHLVGCTPVGGTAAAFQGSATRQVRGGEGGPAAEDVPQDRRLFVGTPGQDLWTGVCEGTRQAGDHTDWGAAPALAGRRGGACRGG